MHERVWLPVRARSLTTAVFARGHHLLTIASFALLGASRDRRTLRVETLMPEDDVNPHREAKINFISV
jgi:hypothetical protein